VQHEGIDLDAELGDHESHPLRAWFKAGLHMELGEAGLTLPGWTMAP